MEISEIKRIVQLLQKVNCERIALISEVAKEMGVKKTALMQFVEDNPKLFKLGEKVRRTKSTQTTLGLGIMQVYLSADENPDTEEWLEKMKKVWDKKIHIGEQNYYGAHEYWLIPEDEGKEGQYRNTPEKIKFLEEKGIIKKVSGGYGGFSDYYRTEYYPYGYEVQKALEDIGWATDFNKRSA
jgi:hypothetical protein